MIGVSDSASATAPAAVTAQPGAALVGVHARLGGAPVLRDVHLALMPGEAALITGPNGAGKTTLLRLLATLVRPSMGRVTILGHDLSAQPASGPPGRSVRAQIAYVAHDPASLPDLTIRENLSLIASLRGVSTASVDRALARVGLLEAGERALRHCSAGMVRRTELARVFLCRPQLLLLDEAHAALDVSARSLVAALVTDVTGRGGSAVLVAHDIDALASVVQRTFVLRAGTVVS